MALKPMERRRSRSGPGSTLSYTCNLRAQLEIFLKTYGIKTFFDAPCGDFHWMKEVAFPPGIAYLGGEIAGSLVDENIRKYASDSRTFLNFDLVADKFPAGDLWFCRDCLFHLPDALIFQALHNFCQSKIELLMMTNHINATGFENVDIEAGEFRRVDFYEAPFHLPRDVLFRIADYVYPFPQREMCVWTREQILAALQQREATQAPRGR